MKWPWSRHRKAQEAADAAARAQERLDEVRRKDAEVNSLAERLREIRDTDHLAELLTAAFRQRR